MIAGGQTYGLALDDTHVYWTNSRDGEVVRKRKSGGSAEVFARGQEVPTEISADNRNVYWINQSAGSRGQVVRKPKSGGEIEIFASGRLSLVLDETHVYWIRGLEIRRRGKWVDASIQSLPGNKMSPLSPSMRTIFIGRSAE